MNVTERLVLEEIKKSLSRASDKGFTYGDIEEWSKYARKMQNVINTVTPILDKLVSEENSVNT